jgi:uncharacterized membrane protein YjgN (DUF898 family)
VPLEERWEDDAVTQTPPPGQPPYGNYPPNLYGGAPYGSFPPQDHPQAMLVLVLGIVGVTVCSLVAPFAWVMGNRVIGEIDASGGQVGGRSTANAGRICGIIGTALIVLMLLVLIGAIVLVLIGAAEA